MIQEHPSALLKEAWINLIRTQAPAAEAQRQLQPQQLELAYQQQWFTMLVPQQYSGKALPLPEVVRLEEAIAWADGSMGWVVTLCSGAGWFGGFMQSSLARRVFANPYACLAGSGAATGTAERIMEGYRISGKWLHASGAPHNTVFTANCIVTEQGQPVATATGEPLIRTFAFDRAEVTLLPSWNAFGLIATASEAFEVQALEVSEERAFILEPDAALVDDPLYHYPFLQLAEITLAANISGMALHFTEEAATFFPSRKTSAQPFLQQLLQQTNESLQAIRESFYHTIDLSWQQLTTAGSITQETLQDVSHHARILATQSRQLAETLYPYCGLAAANGNTTINRAWRDLHTASQHTLLAFPFN